MNNRGALVAIVLFVLVVVGMFIFAYLKSSELKEQVAPQPTAEVPKPGQYDGITRVDAKYFSIEGTHTLVGEIAMPTRCDLLESAATVAESMPEQVSVNFSVINTAGDCAPEVTNQRFKVSFTASKDATIRALFMGREVELNLIPAASGESPDDFELFMKG